MNTTKQTEPVISEAYLDTIKGINYGAGETTLWIKRVDTKRMDDLLERFELIGDITHTPINDGITQSVFIKYRQRFDKHWFINKVYYILLDFNLDDYSYREENKISSRVLSVCILLDSVKDSLPKGLPKTIDKILRRSVQQPRAVDYVAYMLHDLLGVDERYHEESDFSSMVGSIPNKDQPTIRSISRFLLGQGDIPMPEEYRLRHLLKRMPMPLKDISHILKEAYALDDEEINEISSGKYSSYDFVIEHLKYYNVDDVAFKFKEPEIKDNTKVAESFGIIATLIFVGCILYGDHT